MCERLLESKLTEVTCRLVLQKEIDDRLRVFNKMNCFKPIIQLSDEVMASPHRFLPTLFCILGTVNCLGVNSFSSLELDNQSRAFKFEIEQEI